MGAGDAVWMDGAEFKIDQNNFVQGCSMVFGKIFRKMEILVDGTAVLCCEDATKKTNYGNVFEDGVEKVFSYLNYEDSWNEVADLLKVDREPRLNTNRSSMDYKKYVSKKDLDNNFIEWHETHNNFDYLLYKEFC